MKLWTKALSCLALLALLAVPAEAGYIGQIPLTNPGATAKGIVTTTDTIGAAVLHHCAWLTDTNGSIGDSGGICGAGGSGGGFGAQQSIASASTTDLGTKTGNNVLVTGTTTITSFGSSATTASPVWIVTFASTLTLTYNSTSLILPGSGCSPPSNCNITTQANDIAIATYLGGGNWRINVYVPAAGAGTGTLAVGIHSQTFTSSGTFTFPSGWSVQTPVALISCGGGAGGGSSSGGNGGGGAGGGSGSCSDYVLSGFTSGTSLTITVGALGVASTSSATPGGNGTVTTGVYNSNTVTTNNGGTGGTSSVGGAAGTCAHNFTGLTLLDTIASCSGQSGAAGGYGGQSVGFGGAGGSNPLGSGGLPVMMPSTGGSGTVTGQNGTGYGAGGGGCAQGNGAQCTSGQGSAGVYIVQWAL